MSYAVVLISYPTIYYITHPTMDYRHPIDPLVIVLAVCAVLTRSPSNTLTFSNRVG